MQTEYVHGRAIYDIKPDFPNDIVDHFDQSGLWNREANKQIFFRHFLF